MKKKDGIKNCQKKTRSVFVERQLTIVLRLDYRMQGMGLDEAEEERNLDSPRETCECVFYAMYKKL